MLQFQLVKDSITGLDSTRHVKMIKDGIISFVPFDEKNYDYQQYQNWLAAGNQPLASE